MEKIFNQRIYIVLLGALIGGIVGAVIMLYGDSIRDIVNNNYLFIWFFINIFTFSLYLILGIFSWKKAVSYRKYFGKEIIFAATITCLLILFPDTFISVLYPDIIPIITDLSLKILIIIITGVLSVGLPTLLIIWSIQIRLREKLTQTHFSNLSIHQYIRLHNELTFTTLALGLMIGLLVLAAASLRKAHLEAHYIAVSDYPIEFVLLYGAYFTFLLMLIYVPVFLSLNAAGHRICQTLFPIHLTNTDTWATQVSNHEKCQKLLYLKLNPLQNWLKQLAILAPILGSIIAALLEN